MFDFSNYSANSKHYYKSNKLVIGKIKYETGGDAIEKFVELNPKMYSFLVENSKHKKAKGRNRNVVAAIGHNEYEDALLNNKCINELALGYKS